VRVRCDRSLAVRTTPDVILQILGNLVDNACKYAPEDRPVWLVGEGDLVVGDARGLGSSPAGRSRPDPPLRLDALA
jgi:signal transduction histidine kinase